MSVLRVLLVLVLCFGIARAADLSVLKGTKPIQGDLVSIDDKTIVLKTAEGVVTQPLSEVLQLNIQPPPAQVGSNYLQVELTDGSLLNCKPDGFVFKGKDVELTVLPDRKVQLPLRSLSYMLKDAQDPKVRDNPYWKAILKSRQANDMLARLRESIIDGIEGTAETGTGTLLSFKFKSTGTTGDVNLLNKNIQGCAFVNKPDAELPPTLCKLTDMYHGLLMVAKLELKEGGEYVATTVCGVKVPLRRDQVARIDFSWGKQTYLSDLEPTVLDKPRDDVFDREYRKDKNSDGNQMQLAGKRYPKGLFVPAPTKLVYKLGGDYDEFTAEVGVDETVRGRSHVRLLIEGDGKELFSAEFTRADKRRDLRLKVKDVQDLRISVEPVEPFNLSGHHLNLGDAKVSK